jgi:hypothetical protein
MAGAAIYLASRAGDYVVGETIAVDGGIAYADLTPGPVVPDLGPAVVVDQLTVLVWDAYAAGRGAGIPELLTAARRELG